MEARGNEIDTYRSSIKSTVVWSCQQLVQAAKSLDVIIL